MPKFSILPLMIPYILFGIIFLIAVIGLIKNYSLKVHSSLKEISWIGVLTTLISLSLVFQKNILGEENTIVLRLIIVGVTLCLLLLTVLKKKE